MKEFKKEEEIEFVNERLADLIYAYCEVEEGDVKGILGREVLFHIKETYGHLPKSEIRARLMHHACLEDDLK